MTTDSEALVVRSLRELADREMSGSLRVQGHPGGTFHLAGGRVIGAETRHAPGLQDLLIRSGRIPVRAYAAAADFAADSGTVGHHLVRQGLLDTEELDVLVIGTIHDAAYAIVSGSVEGVDVDPAARFWLGPVTDVEVEELVAEVGRRRRTLAALAHPVDPVADRVERARRLPGERIALSSAAWEILAACDGGRTALDVAAHLGRGAYGVSLEISALLDQGALHRLPAAPRRSAPTGSVAMISGVVPATAPRHSAPAVDGAADAPVPAPIGTHAVGTAMAVRPSNSLPARLSRMLRARQTTDGDAAEPPLAPDDRG